MCVAVIAMIAALAAGCGASAPGWVMNPPADYTELVTRFENADWEVEYHTFGGQTTVTAFRASHPEDEMDDLSGSTRVWMETATVMYFATETEATASETMQRAMIAAMEELTPSGVSINWQIRRNGSIVSSWMRISGTMDALNEMENLPF